MRISVKKVQTFEDTGLIAGLQRIVGSASASKNKRRIKAANRIQEDLSNLDAFLTLVKRWKVKRGSYIVPTHHLSLAKKVNLYIRKDTVVQTIKSYLWQRK